MVRALVLLAPIVGGWVTVRALSPYFLRPEGLAGIVVWGLQALVVASVSAAGVDRIATHALPLATLMGMSMTFPDQAPSRFGIAMRTGTVRRLRAELDALERDGLGDDPQQAAERAIELVTVLGRHDRLTRGHTERVRAYADLIAAELGVEAHDRQLLAWGVTLHDIGKLTVPPEILNKDGRPTDEEWAILSAHPAAGARIIEPLAGWLGDWARAAGEHHERWDGGGYPNGLAGTQISLAGRITAVADAYDVITSHRSYKAPLSIGAARKELVDCAGTQFDPAIVRALLQASLRRRRRTAGLFSWLPELPGLATVAQGITAAPAAMATVAVVATAPLTGLASPAPPAELTFTPTSTTVSADVDADTGDGAVPDDEDQTTATTRTAMTGELAPDTTGSTVPDEATTLTAATDQDSARVTSTEPGSSTPTSGSTTQLTTSSTATTVTPATTASTTTTMPTTTATSSTTTTASTSTTAGGTGPTANDDAGTQREGTQKQYAVLSNDVAGDAPLAPATLAVITPPAQGTAEPWASNKIRYQAADGITGTVTIVYQICDTSSVCSQATLTVTLTD